MGIKPCSVTCWQQTHYSPIIYVAPIQWHHALLVYWSSVRNNYKNFGVLLKIFYFYTTFFKQNHHWQDGNGIRLLCINCTRSITLKCCLLLHDSVRFIDGFKHSVHWQLLCDLTWPEDNCYLARVFLDNDDTTTRLVVGYIRSPKPFSHIAAFWINGNICNNISNTGHYYLIYISFTQYIWLHLAVSHFFLNHAKARIDQF